MTLKKRSPLLQAFEVVLFAIAIVGIGYYVDEKDALLIHYDFSFLILWLAIVTLFYGLSMGLVMWITFAGLTTFLYLEDPIYITVLLENLAFVFLFGLFFSNLHSEIDKFKIQNRYFQLRLKELTSAFFTLKISHDKLESIYITQPASFRFVISEVLESCEHNTPELSAKNSLKVLKKFFAVNSAMIYRVNNGSLGRCFASIGKINTKVKKEDKLIEEVLLKKKAVYLKDLEEKEQTAYIYAVPFLDKRNKIVALLIVEEIPFLFYNEDTLLKINVVFTYIWTEYKKRASLDRIEAKKEEDSVYENHEHQAIVDFKLEVARLSNILDGFRIESRIYAIYTENSQVHQEIKEFLYLNEELDILDQYISLECDNRYVHFILFPFMSLASMYQKAKNLDKKLRVIEKSKIEILEEGLEKSLQKEEFRRLQTKHISVKNFSSLLEEYSCV